MKPICFAGQQLLDASHCNVDTPVDTHSYTVAQRTAVLACRIMLPLSRHDTARRLDEALIASHMRTVLSIAQSRGWIDTGYPSEPFLAAAATGQMHS